MSKAAQPELKNFMEKRVLLKLNSGRRVSGTLRGFDVFMNVVLDDSVEEVSITEKHNIGMVLIRGCSITMLSALERV